tara:strand:+ start:17505 stop:17975 length:471 start_codon:yes stop_codon:yes gene_type:complete
LNKIDLEVYMVQFNSSISSPQPKLTSKPISPPQSPSTLSLFSLDDPGYIDIRQFITSLKRTVSYIEDEPYKKLAVTILNHCDDLALIIKSIEKFRDLVQRKELNLLTDLEKITIHSKGAYIFTPTVLADLTAQKNDIILALKNSYKDLVLKAKKTP